MPHINLTVPHTVSESIRLDTFAAHESGGLLTRSQLKAGVSSVRLNGVAAKLSRQVRSGDTIQIDWEDPVPQNLVAQNIPITILYEDENVTVVNKKQGMVVHPANGNWDGTLVHALLFHWNKSIHEGQGIRPGIVHRLDKDTSGVIITARNRESEHYLQKQFAERGVKKHYAAIVCGKLPSQKGEIKTRIVRSRKNRKIFTCASLDSTQGKFAWTRYRCCGVYGNYSLVLLTLKTGRTHQLRVHLKYAGCPILGDPLYGKTDAHYKDATLMLHAVRLGIRLPNSSDFSLFKAPLPPHFKKQIAALKETYGRTR